MQTNNPSSQHNHRSNNVFPVGAGGGGGPPGSNNNNGGASRRTDEKEMEKILSEKLSSKEPHVVSVAMEALAELLFNEDEDDNNAYNKKTALSYGAPLAIVRAMYDNQDSGYAANIWLCGCWSLAYIVVVNQSQKVIIGIGGLNACLLAMDKYPQSSAIHSACCYLIGRLFSCPNSRKAVIDQGGLTAVMQAMENHKHDSGVQTNASYALSNLIFLHQAPIWMKTAVDAGGIEAVIEAMGSHGDCAQVQKNGCIFLETLAKSHEDYRKRILQAKGLSAVAEAFRIHQDNENVLYDARDANIAIIGP